MHSQGLKMNQEGKRIAHQELACELAKAAWQVMAANTDYDEKRVFPELASQKK